MTESSPLTAHHQAALGDAYRLERELGGGGMSRLFLATEASLNRKVVVKLLPPEFTSEVSTARFRQEIEVAAHARQDLKNQLMDELVKQHAFDLPESMIEHNLDMLVEGMKKRQKQDLDEKTVREKFTVDFKGIARSNSENKIFVNCTVFYVGVARNVQGKSSAYGYSKYLDPDGDFVVMESIRDGEETHCRFLQGTGKWKGIQGEGKLRRIAAGKSIAPGTSQYCTRHMGTFVLPK